MKKTLLYVDDEDVNLFLFKHTMDKHFDIITAISGPVGLEKLQHHPEIVAVISDVRMPEMDGVTFIRTAKEKFPDKHYFILTGYSFNEDVENALENKEIVRSFTKPYDVAVIKEAVETLVG